jgi:hypothetical protein
MHYVVFLLGKGMRPYSGIVDVNLPGSYLFEAGAMRILGWSALAWRVYDLLLVILIGFASWVIAKRRRVIAIGLATSMFFLIHVQDGIAQLGQRDLLIAALLMCAYAALFSAQDRPGRGLLIFCSSGCIGLTLIIKPTFLLLGVLLILLSVKHMQRAGLGVVRQLCCWLAGLVLPALCAVVWLARLDSLGAFWQTATTLIPFHAELGHKSFSYLFAHSTSPVAPVCALWLVLLVVARPRLTLERVELLTGIGVAFTAYVVQGKGYPYHRYPLLSLLLLVMSMDFMDGVAEAGAPRIVAATALMFECLILAPHAAWLVRSFSASAPFEQALSSDLAHFGPELDGKVQCLDTFGGCVTTLYNLRLVQSTGYLYDCYLFSPHQNETTARYRKAFWNAFLSAQPRVIVMTDQFCFGDKGGFAKLDNWPELHDEIAEQYTESLEWNPPRLQRWWARSEYPASYRIYVRRP